MESMRKRVAFLTLGCKVNSYESDAMENLFINEGYQVVDFQDIADVYVVNTCTVTNIADRKSRQMLHKAKKNNPSGIVVASGCYVQTSQEEAEKDEAIDIIVGNNQKSHIIQLVNEYIHLQEMKIREMKEQALENGIITNPLNKENQQSNECLSLVENMEHHQEFEEMMIQRTGENTRAYIKIQDGCNQFCSYCIIPYARGRIRSRKKEDIIKEITQLAQNGYKEVVLTGIHISSYGLDLVEKGTNTFYPEFLLELIRDISKIDKIMRIRLGSFEPRIISEEFVSQLSQIQKVCPHFHLSLQSGCDETLKRMNRKYSAAEYEEKCRILRKYFDRPAITTDIIVGFPQETDQEFKETMEFVKTIGFSQIHVFKYSKRKGTKAAVMDGQVDDRIKSERSKTLMELGKKLSTEYCTELKNQEQMVLLEEDAEIQGEKYHIGYSERYIKLAIPWKELPSNSVVGIKILRELEHGTALGEALE